ATGATELADQPIAIGVLHVDPALERRAVAQAEELVRVAREAIPARHLTTAIRVDRPAERHRPTIELVQEILGVKLMIFNATPLVARAPEPLGHSRRRNSRLDRRPAPRRHLCHIIFATSACVEFSRRKKKPGERVASPGSFLTRLPAPPSAAA